MNRRASAQVIILVILVLISLGLAGGGYYLFQQERQKSTDLEEKLDEISTKQRITESKLEDSKKTIADLLLKYEEARGKIEILTSDLEMEKRARIESEAKIVQISADLDQQKELRFDLEDKLGKAQSDVKVTQGQLKDLQVRKTDLEVKVKELEAKTAEIELGKIVVSPEIVAATPCAPTKVATKKQPVPAKAKTTAKTAVAASTGLEGQVLVVNKEYSFAVISLGSKDGVKAGDVFSVSRGKTCLGDIKVEKIHDTMSAAGFASESLKAKIRENDKVVQKVQ